VLFVPDTSPNDSLTICVLTLTLSLSLSLFVIKFNAIERAACTKSLAASMSTSLLQRSGEFTFRSGERGINARFTLVP